VTVYDPMASGNALIAYPELAYADSALAAVRDADVLLVVTAWPEFAQVTPVEAVEVAAAKAVVDACQGIDLDLWQDAGWQVSSLTDARSRRQLDDPALAI